MDRRQRKTRNAIFQAFSALLETKRYSAITVQAIIDAADVGRSTFYAHFDTKEELLRAMCDDIFEHVFSDEGMREPEHDFSSADSFRDRITHILCHLQEKQHHIKGIFAVEAADAVLVSDDIKRLPYLFRLMKKVMQKVHVNILASFVINLTAVVLSALGVLSPVTGALWHNCGSVFVVVNAALLLRMKDE